MSPSTFHRILRGHQQAITGDWSQRNHKSSFIIYPELQLLLNPQNLKAWAGSLDPGVRFFFQSFFCPPLQSVFCSLSLFHWTCLWIAGSLSWPGSKFVHIKLLNPYENQEWDWLSISGSSNILIFKISCPENPENLWDTILIRFYERLSLVSADKSYHINIPY